MTKLLKTLTLSLWASFALVGHVMAQDHLFPALYTVTGVRLDDTLNVREGPAASFPIVTELLAGSQNVEVIELSPDENWGLISITEAHGWVSMHYLARQFGQSGEALPAQFSCYGTEPSWYLELGPNTAKFDVYAGEKAFLSRMWEDRASGMGPYLYGMVLESNTATIHASFSRSICSDGMSDTLFGLSTNVFYSTASGTTLYAGCCSIR